MKVRIEDMHGAFAIEVTKATLKGDTTQRFVFDQEEMHEKLKDVFTLLGHETEYEEVY